MLNYSANGPSGYNLTNSLRFRSSASAYLSRTPASAGNRTTWTISAWVKNAKIDTGGYGLFSTNNSATYLDQINFSGSGMEWIVTNTSGVTQGRLNTTQVFRDPSAWYHFVFVWDTTQATAANRMKMYVNGSQITAFTTQTNPPQNTQSNWNNNILCGIGVNNNGGPLTQYFDGYLTEINFIDGQALTPSSFGSTNATTGVWQPAKYTGTYGTNGFYLTFGNTTSTTTLGYDSSPNGNNWTCNNISLTAGTTYDAMLDVPTNTSATVANYCVWSPIDNGSGSTLSSANLNVSIPSVTGNSRVTIAPSSGKWYWETQFTSNASVGRSGIILTTSANNVSLATTGYALDHSTGQKIINGTSSAYGNSIANNDVVMYALDLDNGKFWIGKNNTWFNSGDPAAGTNPLTTGLSGSFLAAQSGGGGVSMVSNTTFGQRPFSYTPPTGFVALNTFNLPTSTIVKGNSVMDATLYTGNNTGQTITNAGSFRPDFLWIKVRSNTYSHVLADSVRGVSAYLNTDLTAAEGTNSELTSFNSNGFTLGATGSQARNVSGQTYVAWQWQAGQGTNTTNTAGSITSTVSVNTTAGFSVVTYTGNGTNQGATVGHGLGVTPAMVIVKSRVTAPGNWSVWHKSFASQTQGVLSLNLTDAYGTDAYIWGNTAPSSTSFGVGVLSTGNYSNKSGNNYVAYCWAEIAGFSKFGSYTGNGSADGPFVFTGFRPKFMMMKRTDSTSDWYMVDSSRATYNQIGPGLNPNTSSAEFTLGSPTGGALDFLSNGFKWRGTYIDMNANGGTYIYMAFAENPFKNALAR